MVEVLPVIGFRGMAVIDVYAWMLLVIAAGAVFAAVVAFRKRG